MKSPFTFKKYGQCGMEVSELFPYLGECVDDMCFVRSVYTDIPNHEPSMLMMNTGHTQAGRPSLGSWLTYGLGTDNKNLPGYVVPLPGPANHGGTAALEQRFLPAVNQGTFISDKPERPDQLIGKDFDPKKLCPSFTTASSRCRSSAARSTCWRNWTRCASPAKRGIRSSRRDQLDGSGVPDADRSA
jgi:hypothetical protein